MEVVSQKPYQSAVTGRVCVPRQSPYSRYLDSRLAYLRLCSQFPWFTLGNDKLGRVLTYSSHRVRAGVLNIKLRV